MGVIPSGDEVCRFDYQILEAAIKDIVKNKLKDEDAPMGSLPTQLDSCPTFVVATQGLHTDGPPVLFRSYCREGFSADKCTIWEAGRATSAAPSFFKPVLIGQPGAAQEYIDGGLKHNNPCCLAKHEAENIWQNVKRFIIVSIGTGRLDPVHTTSPDGDKKHSILGTMKGLFTNRTVVRGAKAMAHIADVCVKLCTSSEHAHETMLREATTRDLDKRFPYYRFNVERGMEDIGLQEWSKSKLLVASTTRYMREGNGQKNRDACAQSLAKPPPLECK